MNLSYSLAGFPEYGAGEALDAAAAAGFTRIELLGAGASFGEWRIHPGEPPPTPPGRRAAEEFRREIEQRGLCASTVHAPLGRTVLGAPEENWRRGNVRLLGEYLRFAAALGARGLVIHGIPNPAFLPAQRPLRELIPLMVSAMTRSLGELVPVAARCGMSILLENLPYQTGLQTDYPLIRVSQLRSLIEAFPPEQVALVVDTGHSWTNGDEPAEDVRLAGARLGGMHLQDVPREHPADNHWLPTTGGLDWAAITAALRRGGYGGDWTFEAGPRPGEDPQDLARRAFRVAEQWRQTGVGAVALTLRRSPHTVVTCNSSNQMP